MRPPEKVIEAIQHAIRLCSEIGAGGYVCVDCGASRPGTHDDCCRIGVLERYLATLDAPKGETVRVRIAVVIDKDGRYSAAGWNDVTDSDIGDTAMDCTDPDAFDDVNTLCFVEADIPLPKPREPETIEGEVCDGD